MIDSPPSPAPSAVPPAETLVREEVYSRPVSRISWGAVFAGAVVALVIQFLLDLLGIGVGVATLHPNGGDNPSMAGFSIAAGIWYVVAGIIALFIGGYFSSRLSGRPLRSTGGLHGITTWAVTTIVILYLLTTAVGTLVGGAFSTLGNAVGGLEQTAGKAAQTAIPALSKAPDPFGAIEEQIRSASRSNDPQALSRAAVAAVHAALTGNPQQAKDASERAAQALAKAQQISVDQARSEVQRYESQYRSAVQTAKQQAKKAADATVAAVSQGALYGFAALVLGAIAAFLGGLAGTVRRDQRVTPEI